MATCGTCRNFKTCFYEYEQAENEDHEICSKYEAYVPAFLHDIQKSDIEHPSRYMHGNVECFDMLEAALSPREFIGFCKGNILKYIWREKDKGGFEDLQKAEIYAQRLNDFCARMEKPGDVPHDASTGSAADTD